MTMAIVCNTLFELKHSFEQLSCQEHKTVHADSFTSLKYLLIRLSTESMRPTRTQCNNNMLVSKVTSGMGQRAVTYRGPSFLGQLQTDNW